MPRSERPKSEEMTLRIGLVTGRLARPSGKWLYKMLTQLIRTDLGEDIQLNWKATGIRIDFLLH